MKLRKMLKVTLLIQSLLLVSLPVQAGESYWDIFSSWFSSSSSTSGGGMDSAGGSDNNDSINYGDNNISNPVFRQVAAQYQFRHDASTQFSSSFCGGRFQEVQLPGISGLVDKIDEMCSMQKIPEFFNNVKERGMIGFCGYILQKVGNGGCYANLISKAGVNEVEQRILKDPIRAKFIEKEKEQIKKERDKMLQVSSFQMLMAQDPNTLLRLKRKFRRMLTQEKSEELREKFGFNDEQLRSIRDGSIDLKTISDQVFQCKPDEKFYRKDSSFDQTLLNKCDSDEKNEMVKEAYDQLMGNQSTGLLGDQKSPLRDVISQGLGDDYKDILDLHTSSNHDEDSNIKSEQYSMNYIQDTSEMLSLMDSQRTGQKLELTDAIERIFNDTSLSPEEKSRQAQGQALTITIKTLENAFSDDANTKKIMEIIKNDYLVDKDGHQSLDFKSGGVMGALADIRSKLGFDDTQGEVVSGHLRMVLAGANLGKKMLESAAWHRGLALKFGSILSSGSLLPGAPGNNGKFQASLDSPFSSVLGNPNEDDKLLLKLKAYFTTDRNADDPTLNDFLTKLDQTNSKLCEAPETNSSIFSYGLAVAMASECRNLRKPKDEGKGISHLCPSITNPAVSELVIENTMSDPNAFSSDHQEQTMKDIATACLPVSAQAVYFNSEHGAESAHLPDRSDRCEFLNNYSAMIGGESAYDGRFDQFKHNCEQDKTGTSRSLSASIFTRDPRGWGIGDIPPGKISTSHYTHLIRGKEGGRGKKSFSANTVFKSLPNGTPAPAPASEKINDHSKQMGAVAQNSQSSVASGINSNIFDTKRALAPTGIFSPTINPQASSEDNSSDLSSSELKDQIMAKNGVVDPETQKILDRMAAMEAHEKELVSKQSQLLAQINNPKSDAARSKEGPDMAQQLAAVTKELKDLKNQIPDLVSQARQAQTRIEQDKVASNADSSNSSFSSSLNSGNQSSSVSSSTNNSSADNSFQNSGPIASDLSSSSGQSGNSSPSVAYNPYQEGGPATTNGAAIPAYTQNRTFALTQSIRDRAELVPAGVSIEAAVLRSKRPILVPYGNGEYMYVEPQINANGDVETQDGHVVFKEVLKVADGQAIASANTSTGNARAPASVDEVNPNERIYDWDVFSRQLDEAQK